MAERRCARCHTPTERYPCPACGYTGRPRTAQTAGTSAGPNIQRQAPSGAAASGNTAPARRTAASAAGQPAPQRRAAAPAAARRQVQQRAASADAPDSRLRRSAEPPKKKKHRRKKRRSPVPFLIAVLLIAAAVLAVVVYLSVHFWRSASCTAPETCSICGKTRGEPLGHTWVGGDCQTCGVCAVCGAVQDEPPGHLWVRENCLTAGVCSVCGAVESQAPGHDWLEADCENPMRCSRCGETQGEALGHIWDGNQKKPVCSRCGQTLSVEQQAALLLASDAQSVFDSLFAEPDWKELYQKAGSPDTAFEGGGEYVARMSGLAGACTLSPAESGDASAWEVFLGQEQVAEFTLKRKSGKDPHWELDTLTLTVSRPVTLTVQTPAEATVTVNGVKLDDSYIVSRSASAAAEYLPEGTGGLEQYVWQVPDLMLEPELQVYAAGSPVSMTKDAASGVYVAADAVSEPVTDAERTMVFGALENYAAFMINAAGTTKGVSQYFEYGTEIYTGILAMGSELWMNKDRGHLFLDEEISFCRHYSDSLFAVRASLTMMTTLSDGSTRNYKVNQTMFFRLQNGSWGCYAMSNRDLLSPSSGSWITAGEWSDGIRVDEYQGETFTAHVMLIRDPTRLYLGLSSYSGFSESVPGKRLTTAITDEGAVAAVNAGAFNDNGTSDSTVGSIPAGLTIYQGRVVSNIYKGLVPEKGFCGLTADGQLIVAESMTESEAAGQGIYYGCEFGPVLIRNSQVNETARAKTGTNPRTVVAQLADGTILLACADGRQAGSLGATYADMIELLEEYGAVNACNMDGGSSTVMLTSTSSGVNFVNSYSVLQSTPRRMPTFWMVKP